MNSISITLTPEEIVTYRNGNLRTLTRKAEKCKMCHGKGVLSDTIIDDNNNLCYELLPQLCSYCNGKGYAFCPLGEDGNILEHPTPTAFAIDRIYLTRRGEPRLEDENWIAEVE